MTNEQPYHRLRVAEVIEETADTRSLVFDVPPELSGQFAYKPGQFLTLRIPSEQTESVARCYSMSSSPHAGDPLRVTVKHTPEGYASAWILDNVRPGTTLDVLPPAGAFTPKSLDRDFLFLAAGSGITPVLSILGSALAAGNGRCALVYANRDERSVIFADTLTALAKGQPDRFTAVHWLESVQGLPEVAALRALAEPYADRDVYVCGPKPFMAAATEALRGLGVPRDRTHLERFVSLHENPFAEQPTAEQETPAAADGPEATILVTLDGEKHTVAWPAGKKLLDTLLEAGLDAPYSCREGRCSACACVKLEGEVSMINNEVLEEEDLAEGYILACQSLAESDKVTITYE
ncbi:MAG TPA: ferredoxin--NADP reductase [Pseudonocardiaceae bacterium]|jgi:3-ketosteroid 9alpha-monooxygenase subunit B|nr:ferredoxin--NADP reductase [Pseudonocardiaceae bacterium]